MEFIANRPIFPRNSYLVINGVKVNDHNNDGLKFDVEVKSGEEGKVGIQNNFIGVRDNEKRT